MWGFHRVRLRSGRFGYDFVNLPGRIREPLLHRDGKLEPVSKEQARDHLRSLFGKEARIIGIGSPRASLEANFALYALVGAERFYSGMSAADQRLVSLILEILRNGPARAASVRDAEQADAVLVLGESVNGRQSWRLTAKPGRCSRAALSQNGLKHASKHEPCAACADACLALVREVNKTA